MTEFDGNRIERLTTSFAKKTLSTEYFWKEREKMLSMRSLLLVYLNHPISILDLEEYQ